MKKFARVGLGLILVFLQVIGHADDALQVREHEKAFARTMAERDFAAFGQFISEEAIFFAGNKPLRGKLAILEAWRPYYQDTGAPFSWRPTLVEVLASGRLALSSGPVFDLNGKCIGTFNSIWQREGNDWKVIFDRGTSACEFSSEQR